MASDFVTEKEDNFPSLFFLVLSQHLHTKKRRKQKLEPWVNVASHKIPLSLDLEQGTATAHQN